eukprot:6210544-Pleurochrysis_carterae.AAC.7
MWTLLDSRAPGGAQHKQVDSSAKPADEPSQRLAHGSSQALRGNARRKFLSRSMRSSELNIISLAGYANADARRAALAEVVETYVKGYKFEEKDAPFFFDIGDNEGEFALGLTRRTFDEPPEQLAAGEVKVHLYQRISRNHSWGKQPSFKPCMMRKGRSRVATTYTEAVTKVQTCGLSEDESWSTLAMKTEVLESECRFLGDSKKKSTEQAKRGRESKRELDLRS